MARTLLAAAVVLAAAAVASAQTPNRIQTVQTVSPVPAIVIQQQQRFQAAQQQAYLWQLSQPPVIFNNYPTYPDPYSFTPSYSTFRYTGYNSPTGSYYSATKTFYRPANPFGSYSPYGNPFGR